MTPLGTATAHAHSHTPLARDTPHLHPHTTTRPQGTTPMPFSPSHHTPISVGQPLPPFSAAKLNPRTPFSQNDARTPSPNYFGLAIDTATDYTSSGAGQHARTNWSPPNSNVRSTAVASPRVVPLDQNPDLQAFRRQTESFGFPSARLTSFSMAAPPFGRTSSQAKLDSPEPSTSPRSSHFPISPVRTNSSSSGEPHVPATKQRSPKRLLSSTEISAFTDRPRRNSPAGFNQRDEDYTPAQIGNGERLPRASVPADDEARRPPLRQQRSQTVPAVVHGDGTQEGKEGPAFVTPQYVVNLLESKREDVLLLDLRVSSQYGRSRITGALNLCVPPLLLKRPAYNLARLAENFNDNEEQKQKFERWRTCQYVIVYDANSSQMKDATGGVGMLKKFVSEGWTGFQYIIKGGFADFAKSFPDFVTFDSAGSPGAANGVPAESKVAPVVGGCPMPASTTKMAANPFFGNIRQNMDLIGGVGQMDVQQPTNISQNRLDDLPEWLHDAAAPEDHGKQVADKFLQIEKREQKRMQDALSMNIHQGPTTAGGNIRVQLAGIEKGAKNRYNNIWPFEHSRVKLEGVRQDGCDYVNANYLKATGSNKRYIATQSPIPATFADFWTLVWQQDVRVIVMLTAEQEGGQVKAHNYWSDKRFGPYALKFLSEKRASLEPSRIHLHRQASSKNEYARPELPIRRSTAKSASDVSLAKATADQPDKSPVSGSKSDQPFVYVRRFILSNSTEPFAPPREITQLQYTNWPDFGAPAHPAHLLGLVEQTDVVARASYGPKDAAANPQLPQPEQHDRPILVHCSAGCGRTGTFCTVDTVLDMLKRQKLDDTERSKHDDEGVSAVEQMETDNESQNPLTKSVVMPDAPTFGHSQEDTQPKGFDFGDFTTAAPAPASEDKSTEAAPTNAVDLIEKTVEEFRHQRLSSVQSLRQYVLCYESVLEWWAEQDQYSGRGTSVDTKK